MALAGKPAIHRISYVYILRKLYQTGPVQNPKKLILQFVLYLHKGVLIMQKQIAHKQMLFTEKDNG